MSNFLRSHFILFISILLGILVEFSDHNVVIKTSEVISEIFLNYLSMIAAPIVFLSILSTLINMNGFERMKKLGIKVVSYTLLTTFLATVVALVLFLGLDPVSSAVKNTEEVVASQQHSYLHFFTEIVPSNLIKAFAENKVISVAFLGFLIGISVHFLGNEQRRTLQKGFSALFQLFLKLAGIITYVLPIAIGAFAAMLTREIRAGGSETNTLWIYLTVVVLANFIQGVVVLPLLLKFKGISPWKVFKGGYKALLMAFFTKSSNATLPVTLKVAKDELKLHPEVANFTLPICTVINMNGCAAFILTTVLFVAGVNGHVFSAFDLGFWVLMAVLGAVGNAGVPMGCFFLSSAFLISMNVWSDLNVAAIVDKESREEHASVAA